MLAMRLKEFLNLHSGIIAGIYFTPFDTFTPWTTKSLAKPLKTALDDNLLWLFRIFN